MNYEEKRINLVEQLILEKRIKTKEVEKAFLEVKRENFVPDKIKHYAYMDTPREIGKQMSSCDYILMTGDDNYYVPTFVKDITPLMEEDADFIYWDMVHSHYNYQYFNCEPKTHRIAHSVFPLIVKYRHWVLNLYIYDRMLVMPDIGMKNINLTYFSKLSRLHSLLMT